MPTRDKRIPGKVVGEVDATPKKRIVDALRRSDYTVADAVAEYVDNALDAARRHSGGRKGLRIRVSTNTELNAIEIVDNAGGRSPDEISKFVTLGESDLPEAESMGMFGQAAKIAGLAVAREVLVLTRSAHEKALGVMMTEEWLDEPEWTLPIFEPEEDVPPGTTIVRLGGLTSLPEDDASALTGLADELREDYGERYAIVLTQSKGAVTIEINGKNVRARSPYDQLLDKPWAPSPYWCPTTFTKVLAGRSGKPMEVHVTVGLMKRASIVGKYGSYIYCNERLLIKDSDIGFTSRFKQHPEKARLRAIIELRGPAIDMPWTPRKNSLDRNNIMYRHLERIMEQTYIDFFRPLKREISGKGLTANQLIATQIQESLDAGSISASDVPSELAQIPDVRTVLEGGSAPEAPSEEEEIEESEEFIGGYLPKGLVATVRSQMERYYGQRMTKQAVLLEAFRLAERSYSGSAASEES